MLAESRLKKLTLLLAFVSAGSLGACRKDEASSGKPATVASSAEVQRRAEAARRALETLRPAFASLNQKLGALHHEFDPLPPGLPDFGETRSRFYTLSVALGAMTAKPSWLAGRIDAAVAARDAAELSAISKEIADTQAQLRQAEARAAELLQQVQPFKRAAAEKAEELQAFGKTKCE
ncbi:MAG: hypothetical protein EOO73_30645 [Myxococcales bacterium]|nr:MAG: hypothetical protein EOO73_30645 [Myxococcales bacterium]